MENHQELDPYQTPRAGIEHSDKGTVVYNDSGVFSTSGRIGRLRYLAYGIAIALGLLAVVMLLAGLLAAVLGEETGAVVGMGLGALVSVVILIFNIILGVRRLHDLNMSGWMWLINLIPFISIFFALYMVFAPGKEGVNDYGNPPAPNPLWVKIAAWGSLLIVPAIAVLTATIALPAYQGYVEKAKAAQEAVQTMDAVESQEEMDARLEQWSSEPAVSDGSGSGEEMSDADLDELLRELSAEGAGATADGVSQGGVVTEAAPVSEAVPAAGEVAGEMSQEEIDRKMEALLKELEAAREEVQQGQQKSQ